VIGDYAKRDVDLFLLARASRFVFWSRRSVSFAAQFLEFIKDWAKDIGVVIRDSSGEIGEVFCVLNNRAHALETHSRINVTLR
jgi:hypothetical protein